MANSYDLDVSDRPESLGGAPTAAAPAAPATGGYDIDTSDRPESLGGPSAATGQAETPPPPAGHEWGPGLHLIDAILGGHLPGFAESMGPALGVETPKGTREKAEAEREAWAKEHPRQALGAEVAGATIQTAPALMGQEWALAPLVARLGTTVPRLLPFINALRGVGGSEMTGLGGFTTRAGSHLLRGGVEGAESSAIEQAARKGEVTGEEAKKGAEAGATVNALWRALMPRAMRMTPADAATNWLMQAPAHHPGIAREAMRAARPYLRQYGWIPGLIGAERVASEGVGPAIGSAIGSVAAHPMVAAGLAAAGATSYGAERLMASPFYRDRITRAAMGQGIYPWSRVNPLVPAAAQMYNTPEAGR